MAFELSVLGRAPTPDIVTSWQARLAAHGLLCEFHLGFAFGSWEGGFLPIKLVVIPGAFPLAERYGPAPILCGFEFDIHPVSDVHLPSRGAADLLERLRKADWHYYFRTTIGRNVGDLRLQCFGAATLAELTHGLVFDPHQGAYFVGPAALANAAREADSYEDNSSEPHQWQHPLADDPTDGWG